ncbi:hypothetical protein IYX23_02950 [Methylocystis sp. L43]|uniref:hypothetical protein n=1 Tax=unclassified Methylocystis TaxID=2625913 RepID=UPI0018C31FD1|nr:MULTISPECIES: hypothetical protein [unclassified Methylocystis]MBG0796655.1 hypothetical protein [Methylocystis sp. L43]MBG0804626.1 hypothetical protein [Methylocystis sp. H15]
MKRSKNTTTPAPATTAPPVKRSTLGNLKTDDPHALTLVVATDGKLLTKVVFADGSERDYDKAYEIIMTPCDVSTTAKIVALAQELATHPDKCITYGQIAEGVRLDWSVRRLQKARPGDPATLLETPRYVFLLDLDLHDVALPDGFDLHDLHAAAALARAQLPAEFSDVEMVFVASSGYLRKPGLRFRAWVRLSRALTPSQFRRWMHATKPAGRKKPHVDTTPCSANGCNYTASPVFEELSMDPLPNGRIVVLPGNKPTVDAPDDSFFEPAKKPARQTRLATQPKAHTAGTKKAEKAPPAKSEKAPKQQAPAPAKKEEPAAATPDLDETYKHLWDDDAAIEAAREYLASTPGGVQGEGRHDAAVVVFMKLLDVGVTPEKAGDLMFEIWSPKCKPPYVDREELEQEIVGLEFSRESPIGYAHPNANAGQSVGPSIEHATPIEVEFVSLEEGQTRLAQSVQSTIIDFLDWNPERDEPPPAVGVRATVAIGKTEIGLRAIFGALFLIRRRRGKRGRRVITLGVPTHRLGEELVRRFNDIVRKKVESIQQRARDAGMSPLAIERLVRQAGSLRAAAWRGREAEAPDGSGKMCRNLDVVREAQKQQQDIEGKVCKRCEFRDTCAYRQQYRKRADLWLVSHQALFGSQPKPFPAAGVEFVVVDESIERAGLRGLGANEQIIVQLAELAPHATPLPWKMGSANARRLETLRASLSRALDRARQRKDFGRLRAAALTGYEITADDALWAARAEQRRIYRGDDSFLLKQNLSVAPMTRMWKAIADLLREDGPKISGRLELRIMHEGGRKVCELRVTDYDEIHPDFRKPTLLIDANFDAARVKPLFPNIVELDAIDVDAPNVRVLQSFGRSSAKAMLLPQPPADPKAGFTEEEIAKNLTRENNRKALRTNIINLARRSGRTLIITYKELVELLDLPSPIETANFNAIAGRDKWGDFDLLVIIGRPLPPPEAVESIAGAITGRAPIEADRWYEQEPAEQLVRLPNGEGFGVINIEGDRHPDKNAEAHRARICEGEIVQAVGRLRPILRTGDRAATVLILNETPLPELALDGWFDGNAFYRAEPLDRMFAEGGIAFESAADAFRAYPSLWRSQGAALKALQRSGTSGHFRYKEPDTQASLSSCIAEMSTCSFRYQLAAPKQRIKRGSADLSVVSDPRAKLESLLGPLSFFRKRHARKTDRPLRRSAGRYRADA